VDTLLELQKLLFASGRESRDVADLGGRCDDRIGRRSEIVARRRGRRFVIVVDDDGFRFDSNAETFSGVLGDDVCGRRGAFRPRNAGCGNGLALFGLDRPPAFVRQREDVHFGSALVHRSFSGRKKPDRLRDFALKLAQELEELLVSRKALEAGRKLRVPFGNPRTLVVIMIGERRNGVV
jgi:hypothetical protein